MQNIPRVSIAIIGGSSTMTEKFPDNYPGVEIISKGVEYDTPFGLSAPITHAKVNSREFLTVAFHGITSNILNTVPNSAAERLFYVLMKAGVKKIVSTATCGSTNRLLDPADAIIPDGFVDYTTKRAQSLTKSLAAKGVRIEKVSFRLHQAFCPILSHSLYLNAKKSDFPRVFGRGVVGVSEGPRLESPDEVKLRYTNVGIDVVTMNLVPEVFFSREIGACFATIDVVSNYGEGVVSTSWEGGLTFSEFQSNWGHTTAMVLLQTVAEMNPDDDSCGCSSHRWESTVN